MKVSTWIAFGLGVFYLIAALGYGLTAEFTNGFPLLVMAGIGIALFGGYAFLAVRRAERGLAAQEELADPVEPHIGPTIWPFGYALAALGIVAGFLAYQPLYIVGGALFLASSAGWFADVRHQWRHSHEEPPEPGAPFGPDTTPMADEGIL